MEQPIMEPTINKCIEKEFYHEVQHCCLIHTHVINKHIYTHTYTPQYTCDEENVVIKILQMDLNSSESNFDKLIEETRKKELKEKDPFILKKKMF